MTWATVLIDGNNLICSCGRRSIPSLDRPAAGGALQTTTAASWARSAEPAPGHRHGTSPTSGASRTQLSAWWLRSSNYALYSDHEPAADGHLETPGWRSWRSIRIDEAFGRLHRAASSDLSAWGLACGQVRRHPGAARGGGHAPLRVLAKLAKQLAKQDPCHGGVFDLEAVADSRPWLAAVAIEDVWGIGRKSFSALVPPAPAWPNCAARLRELPAVSCGPKAGVVGLRCSRIARAAACRWWRCRPPSRKPASARSFSETDPRAGPLREASRHLHQPSPPRSLRRQHQRSAAITVCFVPQAARSTAPVFF